MKYRVHRFDIKMTRDQAKLEQFLNSLEGEVVAIIPNVTIMVFWIPKVDFLLIVEELPTYRSQDKDFPALPELVEGQAGKSLS